ncbi:MAG: helix-turn-helix domain-containing protein [Actinomycetes bacterium]|nr:helix-turn-helix domain-containing protein [Actinomycetes bacterium]
MYLNNLKSLRLLRGATQVEVAEALNVALASYGRWERMESNPSLTHLVELAQYFEVPIEELFHAEETDRLSTPFLLAG